MGASNSADQSAARLSKRESRTKLHRKAMESSQYVAWEQSALAGTATEEQQAAKNAITALSGEYPSIALGDDLLLRVHDLSGDCLLRNESGVSSTLVSPVASGRRAMEVHLPARSAHSCVSVSPDCVLVFGGAEGTRVRNEAFLIDVAGAADVTAVETKECGDIVVQEAEQLGVCFYERVRLQGAAPSARSGAAMVALDSEGDDDPNVHVLVHGGYDGVQYLSDLHFMCVRNRGAKSTNEVTTQLLLMYGTLPTPRAHHTMVALSPHTVFVWGGVCGTHALDDGYVLDLLHMESNKVPLRGTVPSARFAHVSVMISPVHLLIWGGVTAQPEDPSVVYVLDTVQLEFTQYELSGDVPPTLLRYASAALLAPNRLLLSGGGDADCNDSGDMYLINTETLTCIRVAEDASPHMPGPRFRHAMLAMRGLPGRVLMYGGCGALEDLSDCYLLTALTTDGIPVPDIMAAAGAAVAVDDEISDALRALDMDNMLGDDDDDDEDDGDGNADGDACDHGDD